MQICQIKMQLTACKIVSFCELCFGRNWYFLFNEFLYAFKLKFLKMYYNDGYCYLDQKYSYISNKRIYVSDCISFS